MDNCVKFWNDFHTRYDRGSLTEERCWDRFAGRFSAADGPVLDLACGTGSDSLWLRNRGIPSLAGDYSLKGLKLFHGYLPEIPAVCFDMTGTFPFPSGAFGMLICDMGLHFFPEEKTFFILNEVRRILRSGGTAFFRVNAMEDMDPEKAAAEIDPRFYHLKDDVDMRYFTPEDIEYFFADWSGCEAERTQMTRYGSLRETWTLCCQK